MELTELKNIWQQLDQKIDQPITVDRSFMKKLSLEKTQSSLTHLKVEAVIELLVNFLFVSPFVSYAINHWQEPKFALPALLLALMGVATIAWNIYSLIMLSTLSYVDSITIAQKRLTAFRYRDLFRQRTLLYILLPLSWGAILVLFCKVVLRLDLYQYPLFLVTNMIASIALVPIMIWVAKKFPDKKMDEALRFLESIRKFEEDV